MTDFFVLLRRVQAFLLTYLLTYLLILFLLFSLGDGVQKKLAESFQIESG